MSDDRPRPEYGEYATPEEQARAAGQTYVPPPPVQRPPAARFPGESADMHEHDGVQARPGQPDVPVFSRPRFIDRIVTNGLLLIGVLSFIQSISGDLSFGASLKATASALGVTDFQPWASLDTVGRWLLVINFVLLVASIVVSVVVARRGHITFYIPVVGFLLFSLSQAIIMYSAAPALFSQIGERFFG